MQINCALCTLNGFTFFTDEFRRMHIFAHFRTVGRRTIAWHAGNAACRPPLREYSVMAFKVPDNQSLHKLRLKREVDKVVSLLRREVGSDFLQNTRLVIAFCVRGASFRLT